MCVNFEVGGRAESTEEPLLKCDLRDLTESSDCLSVLLCFFRIPFNLTGSESEPVPAVRFLFFLLGGFAGPARLSISDSELDSTFSTLRPRLRSRFPRDFGFFTFDEGPLSEPEAFGVETGAFSSLSNWSSKLTCYRVCQNF